MYVEFHSEGEFLQKTLRPVSDVEVEIYEFAKGGRTQLRAIVQAKGTGLDSFEDRLAQDETVDEYECIASEPKNKTYQVVATPDTLEHRVYETTVDLGGIYHSVTATDGGWYVKMNFPDRETFQQYQSLLAEHGIDIQITIVREGKFFLSEEIFGLTEKQQEVISEAIRTGYFEVPRRASLSDIATRVGISDQAASERIRRAMRTIAENGVSGSLKGSP
jgi:predicted DNA binding protein